MEPLQINFYLTHAVNSTMGNQAMTEAVQNAVTRFSDLDFGKVPPEDVAANIADLKNHTGHVLGRYESPLQDLYINLEFGEEPGEAVALVMFVSEY